MNRRRTHFTAVDAAIPNRSAAARRLIPDATALCLGGAPGQPLRGDVGPVLLAGVRGFF